MAGNGTPTIEYMRRKHISLRNDYIALCTMVASDIAERLLAEGRMPHITRFRGKPYGDNHKSLVPQVYKGRISFGIHLVACVDGQAYDPMIGVKPVPVEEYGKIAFGAQEVNMDVVISEEKIQEFVDR